MYRMSYSSYKIMRTLCQEVEAAIRRGDIHWHALPFNAQLEFSNRQLLQMQTILVRQMDDRFNVTRKRVASLVQPLLPFTCMASDIYHWQMWSKPYRLAFQVSDDIHTPARLPICRKAQTRVLPVHWSISKTPEACTDKQRAKMKEG
jgi:hypothetical protein